jgi:23S rRNA (uracil1939-C5)-methyltransferase
MRENHIPAYDETSGQGLIRHLYLRGDSRRMAACLVATDRVADSAVAALRQACPELTGVLLCRNKERGNVVLSGSMETLWGQDTWEETLCGATFTLSPLTFFQVNSAQAEKLYRLAGEYAQPEGKVVLDLYCGAGTIGLSVARSAKKLLGNDIVPSAVENARRNAQKNGVSQAEYFCGDAAQVAQKLAADGLHPDVIITDPPRKGMDKAVLDALVTMAPERIVYVSCDPGTLARDLKYLAAQGYTPTHATAVDMFPRTHHVETVCLLTKR